MSTPFSPMTGAIAAPNPALPVTTPTSSPCGLSFSNFSAEREVPITLAPRYLASTSAVTPTPEGAAVTSTVSPLASWPLAKRASCTTTKTTGTQAASSHDKLAGTAIASRASTRQYSANPPAHRPIARSPGFQPVTPLPTSTISPAASPPPTRASGAGLPGCVRIVWSRRNSARLIDEACTRKRIWPGGTTGRCVSRTSQVPPSGPGTMIAAFMLFLRCGRAGAWAQATIPRQTRSIVAEWWGKYRNAVSSGRNWLMADSHVPASGFALPDPPAALQWPLRIAGEEGSL